MNVLLPSVEYFMTIWSIGKYHESPSTLTLSLSLSWSPGLGSRGGQPLLSLFVITTKHEFQSVQKTIAKFDRVLMPLYINSTQFDLMVNRRDINFIVNVSPEIGVA